MRTVWKFPVDMLTLDAEDRAEVVLPKGARIIHADHQAMTGEAIVMLWAEVEPTGEEERRAVWVIGTGGQVPDGAEHVVTYQQPPFVWHVYVEPAA